MRDVPVFVSGFSISVQQSKIAPANQPPDFHYNVNDRREELAVWVGYCGNMLAICWVLSETLWTKLFKPFK